MKYQATARGEWPTGVHWSPGEIRDLDGWPGADGDPPPWLKRAKAKAKAKPKAKANAKAPKAS